MSETEISYRSNPLLKKCGIDLSYTQEQIEEYIKCSRDPIYFIENYVKIINVDDGVVPFRLYEFQKELITAVHENRRVVGRIGRQSGKCFYINTPIKLRNKATGEIVETTIGEFYEKQNQIQPKTNNCDICGDEFFQSKYNLTRCEKCKSNGLKRCSKHNEVVLGKHKSCRSEEHTSELQSH